MIPSCPSGSSADRSYAAIEATLSATAPGRAFLAEHRRRGRSSETQLLLDAVARLEARAAGRGPAGDERTRLDEIVAGMSDSLRQALAGTGESGSGPIAPAEVAAEMSGASAAIVDAAERVQDTAWTLRERGFEPGVCDVLDGCAAAISDACKASESAARQAVGLAGAVAAIEAELAALRKIADERGSPVPRSGPDPETPADGLSGASDDSMLGGAEARRRPGGPAPAPMSRDAALAELERLSALPTRDQLRLLT